MAQGQQRESTPGGAIELQRPGGIDSVPMLLNVRQAAERMGISDRMLWQLTHDRKIPHVRIGRRVLYAAADLAAWIDSQKQGCRPASAV
jgi:excisionase family DNA binding protein